jgi:hypothetical protein
MRTALDFYSAQFDRVRGNLVQSKLEDLKCELILIQSKDRINFLSSPWSWTHQDMDQYTSSGYPHYPVLPCEQNKAIWLANLLMNYSWVWDTTFSTITIILSFSLVYFRQNGPSLKQHGLMGVIIEGICPRTPRFYVRKDPVVCLWHILL